ncbi:MAG TPA: tetratricopeptide repeat protein [Burkholderiales bacterium]|nr:tetratricopeptide repeat protein [Burkholderiales bacterium]
MNPSRAAIFAQGVAALRAGDFSTAERILLTIVEQDEAAHNAWHALSVVAVRAGLPDIGIERARRAVALDRRNAEYLNSLGIACTENEELAAAEHAFRRALKIKPAFAEGHYNLAKVLRHQGKLAEALVEYQRAHALEPWAVPAQLGLAAIYRLHGKPERALAVLRAAVRDRTPDPDHIPYLVDCIADVEGPDAAIAWLEDLLAGQPDFQQAHHILGRLLLSVGHWREGWKHFLWRAHRDPERMRTRPAVLPERLDGKRVFLRAEEGIGDILLFLRFAAELRARGAEIALELPSELAKLIPLLADQIVIDKPAACDLPVWIADLPALLQTDATPPPLALPADEARSASAKRKLAQLGPPPYLGLTWRAGTNVRRARELGADQAGLRMLLKEISPALLGQAVRGWPGTLVSLQRGPAPDELGAIRAAAGVAVHDLAAANDDLRDALALLGQLDEYVAVVNTNIHLLAGLGRAARVLAPQPPDWRWMREGESPWFPGFPVYRQPPGLDWAEPLTRLREDLLASAGSLPRARA